MCGCFGEINDDDDCIVSFTNDYDVDAVLRWTIAPSRLMRQIGVAAWHKYFTKEVRTMNLLPNLPATVWRHAFHGSDRLNKHVTPDDSGSRSVANNVMQWLFTRRCLLFSWSLGQRHAHSPHASSAKPPAVAAAAAAGRRQRRRLRRQNALTRASVKLSDKLIRQRKSVR